MCHLVLSRSGQCARFREGETSTFRGSVAHPGHTASEGGARVFAPPEHGLLSLALQPSPATGQCCVDQPVSVTDLLFLTS